MIAPLCAALLLLGDLLYPLDHPPSVSSTLGAYRLGHHHAGLDLITGDDDTVKVLAADEGEIYKIRRSAGGYGRSLYVRHPSGQVTVYAHLSAFAPKLLPWVRRFGAKGFQFSHNVKGIPVKRGEPLGYVGTSGTDLIHLHFEVREAGAPVNPLTHGLKIPDTQPPRFKRLYAYARQPKAHVNGGHDEVFLSFDEAGRLAAPVRIGGDVALLVEVDDTIDGSPRALRPYRLQLKIDGVIWYEGVYERTSYSDKGDTELDYDARLRAAREGVFHRLYRHGRRLRHHRVSKSSFKGLKAGAHTAELLAEDAAGLTAKATFTLKVEPPQPPCALGPLSKAARRAALKGAELGWISAAWRDQMVVLPLPEGICQAGTLSVLEGEKIIKRGWALTRLGDAPALAVTLNGDKPTPLRVLTPLGRISLDALGVAPGAEWATPLVGIKAAKDAGFEAFPTALRVLEAADAPGWAPPGLMPASPLYRFENGWAPTRRGLSVGLAVGEGVDWAGLGLYLRDRQAWWRLGGQPKDGLIYGWTAHLTDLAVMRDVTPPTIGALRVEAHPGGRRIIVPVEDLGAGVLKVLAQIDGAPISLEWMRSFQRVAYNPTEFSAEGLKPGAHTLTMQVVDRAGRGATARLAFTWPEE
ncbi:M23 family metallopeptidase [Myxococcota bacterium]|nr:M23 family metallopeptidase [Myxococcota bacterium]MBU1899938.1 M23 family metallopeptidase [Myxococcota bacterium]